MPRLLDAMDAREEHLFVIDFLLAGRTPGELLATKEIEKAQAVMRFVRRGPDPDLALTDPPLFERLSSAVASLQVRGWS